MLCACFDPCFRLLLRLSDNALSGRAMQHEAQALLAEAVSLARRKYDAATVETAQRMVEAWMDEMALAAPWKGRMDWLCAPLQQRWGEGRRAGDWFFQVTEHLSPDILSDVALAGIALRCLGLGFQGRFHDDLSALAVHHRLLAVRFRRVVVGQAFPPAPCLPARGGLFRRGRHAEFLLVGLVVCLFFAFWMFSNHRLQQEILPAARDGIAYDSLGKTP